MAAHDLPGRAGAVPRRMTGRMAAGIPTSGRCRFPFSSLSPPKGGCSSKGGIPRADYAALAGDILSAREIGPASSIAPAGPWRSTWRRHRPPPFRCTGPRTTSPAPPAPRSAAGSSPPRGADHPEPGERWIPAAALHDATQTNAGQRLTRPAALGAWLRAALALRATERWEAELPPGLEDQRDLGRPPAGRPARHPAPVGRRRACGASPAPARRRTAHRRQRHTSQHTSQLLGSQPPPRRPPRRDLPSLPGVSGPDGGAAPWPPSAGGRSGLAGPPPAINDGWSRLLLADARTFSALQPSSRRAVTPPHGDLAQMIIGEGSSRLQRWGRPALIPPSAGRARITWEGGAKARQSCPALDRRGECGIE